MAITKIRQSQIKNLEYDLIEFKEQIKTFKQPVDLFENMPIVDNNNGDLRVCLEDGNIYIWNDIDQEWKLNSGSGGIYTRTLSFTISEDNQNEINTKIRFDETTDLQTTTELVNVYLNGVLVDPSCYESKRVNNELIIEWISSEELLKDDLINVQYYNTTGGISGSGNSKYEHPETHEASMIILNNGKNVEEEMLLKANASDVYTKIETDSKIKDIIGAAPEALDTLKELADALNNDSNFVSTITNELSKKVDKIEGKDLSSNDYTDEEKNKLQNIEENANNYIHPETHDISMITGLHACATSGDADTLNGKLDTYFASNEDLLALSGNNTTNLGDYAHSEGNSTNKATDIITNLSTSTSNDDIKTVWDTSKFSLAKGDYSHIEGGDNLVLSIYSHAEGNETIASGKASHAEGYGTIASGDYSHAEGGISIHDDDMGEGYTKITIASGNYSHAEGGGTTASGDYSHAEGYDTTASGNYSHAEGEGTTASGDYSHAEGGYSDASGDYSHAEGGVTTASGDYSHAEGYNTTASGDYSHSEGYSSKASGIYSHAEGYNTQSYTPYQHVQGKYNKYETGSETNFVATQNAFIIGNGTFSARSNAFRVTFDGKTYGLSAFNSTGADYAEYFEWQDGNIDNEDRIGYFVTLDGDKIKKASNNDYILGVISANCSVIGNSVEDSWGDMYLRDEFGRLIYEDVEVDAEYKVIPAVTHIEMDAEGNKTEIIDKEEEKICIKEAGAEKHIKLNPNYDNTKEYIPRSERKEWDVVGMLGQLIVRDDGTCEINGYCSTNENGIATKSDVGYRVLKRINESLVLILFK